MAGGSIGPAGVAKERAEQYQGRVTLSVIIACVIAAVGGSLFGYDIGISGTLFLIYLFFYQDLMEIDELILFLLKENILTGILGGCDGSKATMK